MQATTQYHTHISSKHRWFELNLKEVWQYREYVLNLKKEKIEWI